MDGNSSKPNTCATTTPPSTPMESYSSKPMFAKNKRTRIPVRIKQTRISIGNKGNSPKPTSANKKPPSEGGEPTTLTTSLSQTSICSSQSTQSVVKPSSSTSKTLSKTGKATRMSDSNKQNMEKPPNSLYLKLDENIDEKDFEKIKKRLRKKVITIKECDEVKDLQDICFILERNKFIKPEENNYNFLVELFDELRRGDLKSMVKDHVEGQIKKAPGNPEDLYNMDAILQPDRVKEPVEVLKQYSLDKKGHNPSTIPQRIFYMNTAAGIARNDSELELKLGKDDAVTVTVRQGAVKKTEIISCYYTEESICCKLGKEDNHVLYSIPVTFEPPNLEFEKAVMLLTKHSAVMDPMACGQPKLHILDSNGKWRKIDKQDGTCQLHKHVANITLDHFSTFVLAVDQKKTSSLPLLKTRILAATTKPDKQERSPQRVIICVVFDNDFTIKKSQQIVKEKFGAKLDIGNSDELLLKPLTQGKIEVSGMWVNKTPTLNISVEDVQNLISAPIIHSAELISKQQKLQNTCQIVVTQEDMCQKFEVSVDDFRFVKNMCKSDTETHCEELTCGELGHAPGSTLKENHDMTWLYDGITKKITELGKEMRDESLQNNNRLKEENRLELENMLESVKSQVSKLSQEFIKLKEANNSELQKENKKMSEKLIEVTNRSNQDKSELEKLKVQLENEVKCRQAPERQQSVSENISQGKRSHEKHFEPRNVDADNLTSTLSKKDALNIMMFSKMLAEIMFNVSKPLQEKLCVIQNESLTNDLHSEQNSDWSQKVERSTSGDESNSEDESLYT